MLIATLLLGCSACSSCITIDLDEPSNEQPDEPANEPEQPEDTGDTAQAYEPPPCPVMEEEPNSTYDEAQWVPMEQWVCGTFESQVDLDVFDIDFPEAGWLKVWVRSQELGSTADTLVSIKNGPDTALSTFYLESTDPMMIVPIREAMTIQVAIQEQYNGSGENHFWEALFSQDKQPILYNKLETEEPNDGIVSGQYVEDGDRVFGIIDNNYDRDWYLLEVPEGSHDITLSIEANQFGSPIDAMIYLYPPETFENPDTNYVKYRNHGLNPNSTDPYLTYTIRDAGVWGIQIKTYNSSGSDFYWYVLDVKVDSDG